jgi:mRNA interferase HigB
LEQSKTRFLFRNPGPFPQIGLPRGRLVLNPVKTPAAAASHFWITLNLRQSQFGTMVRIMRVIAISTLRQFWEKHPDAEQPIKAWVDEADKAQWSQPADIKAQYRSASILKNRRVVFNIKGNDYRLIVAVAFKLGIVYVKFIGTHAEYDKIDAETIEME